MTDVTFHLLKGRVGEDNCLDTSRLYLNESNINGTCNNSTVTLKDTSEDNSVPLINKYSTCTNAPDYNINDIETLLNSNNYKIVNLFEACNLIYLDKNYYIGFCKKYPHGFMRMGAIKAGEFGLMSEPWFRLEEFVISDSYWTINSLFKPAPWIIKETRLPDFRKSKEHFKKLNAVWVDFDIGRPDDENPAKRISCELALSRIFEYVQSETIPEPSIIVLSGRGLYAMWLINDECGQAVEANSRTKRRVEAINRKIIERLKELAPDNIAVPVTQVLRFPGVVHSKTGNVTSYFAKAGVRYTLDYLMDYFNVGIVSKGQPFIQNKTINQVRLRAAQTLNTYYYNDILKIEAAVGGFKEGKRNEALRTYAQFLRNAGVPRCEAIAHVKEMALRCVPPCEIAQNTTVEGLVKWVYKSPCIKYSAKTLCAKFAVTAEVARKLDLRSIIPPEVRQERKEQIRQQKKAKYRKAERDALIRQSRLENPSISASKIASLCVQNGFPITRQHIGRLLKRWLNPSMIPESIAA